MDESFKELMNEDNTQRNSVDSSTFEPLIESMFAEWNNAKPPFRQKIKSNLRLKLLDQIKDDSIVELKGHIIELQLKMKQNEMRNAKRIRSINDEKQKHTNHLQDIWKGERVKWKNKMKILRTENESLKNGDGGSQQSVTPRHSEEKFAVKDQNAMKQKISELESQIACISKKYKAAMELKRKYFNQVQNLKGNIRVFARSRPILPIDGDDQRSSVNFFDDKTLEITNDKGSHLFSFDKVFDAQSEQEQVYEDVSPLIESVMDGYNCCIFAYGQTGSGKTYTMQGDESNPGVNIRALQHLFYIAEQRKPDFVFEIKVSMIEIYNEKIRDLLVNKQKEYKIRKGKTGQFIENVSIHKVLSEEDVQRLMEDGIKSRSMACTNSNAASSRSHMVLMISVTGTNEMAKLSYSGKLNLIDLAGCERVKKSGVQGDQLKEATNINKSLSALGDVISALSKKSKHIPFRNSTLTHMLQDSLGGNAKTLMFTNISQAQNHYGETLNALKFAQRAKAVELGGSKRSVMYHRNSAPATSRNNKTRLKARSRSRSTRDWNK